LPGFAYKLPYTQREFLLASRSPAHQTPVLPHPALRVSELIELIKNMNSRAASTAVNMIAGRTRVPDTEVRYFPALRGLHGRVSWLIS